MSETEPETLSVVMEREMPFPPERIWRALTQPHLIAEWLMKTDFQPVVGQDFSLTADWGSVDCKVLAMEPHKSLTYSWGAMGVETIVTWTLTPTGAGTQLRMEQSGFAATNQRAYQGAHFGWRKFLAELDRVVESLA